MVLYTKFGSMVPIRSGKADRPTTILPGKELIHKLAPDAVIFGREDVRWCGNEAGGTRPTEWNVVPYPADPDTMTQFADMTDAVLGGRDELYKGKYLHYQQAENQYIHPRRLVLPGRYTSAG